MSDEVDGSFLVQMQRNEAAGLGGLYDRHAGRLLGLARRIVGHGGDAEEVVQEVFLQAWNQRHRYDEARGEVLGWLLMITRSRALDRVRASRSRLTAHMRWADGAPTAAVQTGDVLLSRWARTAMASLPYDQRLAVELAFFAGFTYSEIATLLRQPLGTVKTRMRLAILKLRDRPARYDAPNRSLETPFTVPVSALLADPVRAPKFEPLEGVRVLVVDDNPDTLDMVSTVLQCAGASVMKGRSTTDALTRLATEWPDVLLADLSMPGEEGFALVRKARALEGAERRLRAGAFTALTDDRDRRAALDAGYDVYLTKPIQPRAIVEAVAGLAGSEA